MSALIIRELKAQRRSLALALLGECEPHILDAAKALATWVLAFDVQHEQAVVESEPAPKVPTVEDEIVRLGGRTYRKPYCTGKRKR